MGVPQGSHKDDIAATAGPDAVVGWGDLLDWSKAFCTLFHLHTKNM